MKMAALLALGAALCSGADRIAATVHDSGLALSHDSYNAISTASDGRIYYVLSTESIDIGAQMYVFDPATQTISHLGDLTEACGEKGARSIPQGKSHVNFVEANGKLYFATHLGYYSIEDGMETMGKPPAGYKPYPGGHFLSYDMKTKQFENLALAPGGEGIITMNMDTRRGRLYGLTWPTGMFIRYDLATRTLRNLGPVANRGEAGKGPTYQTICRSLAVDPRDGSVYFTNSSGTIFRYRYDRDAIETVSGDNLRKDYFGLYDPTSAGHMGYNWRQTVWSEADGVIYGVHGNSGYLFRFDPRAERVDILDRITSLPSKASGMFDEFSYGYLGFTLGPDGHTLHYLTGGPIYENGKRVAGKESTAKGEAKGMEDLHLVSYDLRTGTYRDNGAVFLPDGSRPTYVNSIAVGKDGTVYTLARITVNGATRADLISFPGPLSK
ncbi:MAG: hypothetical protein P4K98_08665 [Bryobacteraceae bacterium]|nr:hypothetical protein [Bryobacteraceae bacterium]